MTNELSETHEGASATDWRRATSWGSVQGPETLAPLAHSEESLFQRGTDALLRGARNGEEVTQSVQPFPGHVVMSPPSSSLYISGFQP